MIVVDSSAVVAIMRAESDAVALTDILDRAPAAVMSAVSYVETNMVLTGRRMDLDAPSVDALLASLGIEIADVTVDQAKIAVAAFTRYGKGRHAARLNIADCFSYALAHSRGAPLLYKGEDFAKTDIVAAWTSR